MSRVSGRRIAVVSPYGAAYQGKLIKRFGEEGFEVVAEAHAGISDNLDFAAMSDEAIATMMREVATARPDAILSWCTNMPTAYVVDGLERELRIPILDSTTLGLACAAPDRSARWPGASLGAALRDPEPIAMSTLFRDVQFLDLARESGMTAPTDLLVEGDRIAAIGPDAARLVPRDARIVDGAGKLLLPGLINAHFHSPVNHMKGQLDSLPLEIFMLYESPALEALRPTPREAYVRTQLACAEMLKAGVTAVQDDAFFVPEPATEIIDAVMQAYADSGIRATVALDEPNLPELDKLPFLAGILPSDLRAELAKPRSFEPRICWRCTASDLALAWRL